MAGRRQANDPLVKISKSLSYLLRHGAEKEGFRFQPGGYLYVDEILKHKNFQSVSVENIKHIVENNDKQRFALEEDTATGRLKIRANQGHSLEVDDLELKPITEASDYPVVVHGTNDRAYRSIASQGLKTMGRNHIHFAAGEPGVSGVISGMRASCTVMIYLNLSKALQDGLKFFLSANGVILSPGNDDGIIPPVYFDKVIDRRTGSSI
ncbi:hypothetical protein BsWGS_10281 [Bradybaena similaris]